MRCEPREIPVVILAGGRGTRLMEETRVVPKPMVTVGGQPILLHIMRYYGSFGFRRFVICLGYRGHVIREYFQGGRGRSASSGWDVALVETGRDSLTGTRLRRVSGRLDAPHFCLTYGDGVADIDLAAELRFHLGHGRLGTVTAVHPPARFGRLDLSETGRVRSFREKEALPHDFINGGFFMFRREFLERLAGSRNESLEHGALSRLAEEGELFAFRHAGFWQCMDTVRDREALEQVCRKGKAPWIKW